jgi:hypothetical protein
LVASFATRDARAADEVGYRVGAEIDPLPFFEHGFSVHAEAKPLARLRLTFGAFALRSSTTAGDNQGFTEEQRAFELSAQYCALPWSGGGLFVGAYAFFQRWEYSRSDTADHAVAYWLTPAPAVAFQWLPWKHGPYLAPWIALGFPIRRGANQVGAHVYDEPGIFPVFALHIGYELELPGTRSSRQGMQYR